MQVWSSYFPSMEIGQGLPEELDSPQTLVLMFSGAPADQVAPCIERVRRAFPLSVLTGCSTAGEVHGMMVRDGGVTVCVARFDQTSLTVARASVPEPDASYAGGVQLAGQLAGQSLAGVLVFSDGLTINGSRLLQGLNSVLPEQVVVTGGLAGDADRFERTWVIADDRPKAGTVIALGLYGDTVQVRHGSRGGWGIFGPERLVTRSEGNVVYELDGQPVLDLYETYLGDLAAGLPGTGLLFPLSIWAEHQGDPLVRTLLAVDRQARSITFAGDVPTGWTAQLMRANVDRLVGGAADAAGELRSADLAAPGGYLGMAVSCVGRRLVLKERVEEELEAVAQHLPAGTELIGFYSYGEISPLASGRCDLHNQTMTVTLIAEPDQ